MAERGSFRVAALKMRVPVMTARSPSLLPARTPPKVERLGRLSVRAADDLDAILIIIPMDSAPSVFAALPHEQLWRQLHAGRTHAGRPAAAGAGRTPLRGAAPSGSRKSGPGPGSIRSINLTNSRHTRLILGIIQPNASAFETLSLAGRMARDLGSSTPAAVALAAPTDAGVAAGALEALLSATLACAFEMPSFRSTRKQVPSLQQVLVLGGSLDLPRIKVAAAANGLARWLTALPPNKLDASHYQRVLRELARRHGLNFSWLSEARLKRMGAGAFLAVSQGNAERTAGIAHLSYRPPRHRGRSVDVALVGKGVLFDTGGTNLKNHRGMLDMHTDMNGSAVAVATLCALADQRSPLAVDAWLAITENRTGPNAFVPQDVVTAINGVSIQVVHTDAEGRMVLADTLALAARTRPGLIVDYATLTGACVTALGERMSGIFVQPPKLAQAALAAGEASGERVWNFPMDADYDGELESRVADVMQCSADSKADHILAARFLSRFVPAGTPWIHLDLAAAVRGGGLAHVNTDITGFGVRYTLQLLRDGKLPG